MGIDQNLIFLEGNYVWLKVLSQSDILESSWVGWFNDEERNRYNTHHYWPNTYENQQTFLAQSISPNKIQLGIIDKDEPESICGVISLQQINLIDRTAEIATMMDKRTRTKPNIFIESWSLLLKHGFQELGLNKIYGGSINTRIPKLLCELFNFEIEGTLKNHVFKGGKYVDVIQSAVFKETIRFPKQINIILS